jgi:hypothetical protein
VIATRLVRSAAAVALLVLVLGVTGPAHAQGAPDATSVLVTNVGFGMRATGDTPLSLGAVVRTFESGHANLQMTAIPVTPPVKPATLFKTIAGAQAGMDEIAEPSFGLASWYVAKGTSLGEGTSAWLFAASPSWVFSCLLTTDGAARLDLVAVVTSVMRAQLERGGGLIAAEAPRAEPSGDATRLIALLPDRAAGLAVVGTLQADGEPVNGVKITSDVQRFLTERSTGVLRLFRRGDATAAVTLTEYPFDLFASAGLGANKNLPETRLVSIPGADRVVDIVAFEGFGSRAGQLGAAFRRGRLLVLVLAADSRTVSRRQVEAVVASLAIDAAGRLPDGASSAYVFPGTPSTVAGLSLSSALVTSVWLGLRGATRLRAGPLNLLPPGEVAGPDVVDLEHDALRLRKRAWRVLIGQLLFMNIGIGALAGDFAWTGVAVAVLALIGGMWFTARWRRYEDAVLGSAARGPWVRPRLVGVLFGGVAVSVLGFGVGFSVKGLRYLVLAPTLAQLKWSNFFGISPRAVGVLFALGGIALAAIGAGLFRLARAHAHSGTKAVLQADVRQPILYLRSFEDDTVKLRSIVSARIPFLELFSVRGADPFEETLAWELSTYGPVIAIARPGGSIASLGAAREFLPDATWKQEVADRIASASAIILTIGQTEGLGWEVRRVVESGHLPKAVFIFPPVGVDALTRRWEFTADALEQAGVHVPALSVDVDRVLTVTVSSGRCIATVSRRRDESSYRTAIDRALERLADDAKNAPGPTTEAASQRRSTFGTIPH